MIKDDFVIKSGVDISLMRNTVLIDLYTKMPACPYVDHGNTCGSTKASVKLAFFTVKNKDGDFSGGEITEFLYDPVRDDCIYYIYSNGVDKAVHIGFAATLKGVVKIIMAIEEGLIK